jgi:hypothetical protein
MGRPTKFCWVGGPLRAEAEAQRRLSEPAKLGGSVVVPAAHSTAAVLVLAGQQSLAAQQGYEVLICKERSFSPGPSFPHDQPYAMTVDMEAK